MGRNLLQLCTQESCMFILHPEIAERAEGPRGDLGIYFGPPSIYWKDGVMRWLRKDWQ